MVIVVFIEDKQSRITRYSVNGYQLINGEKVFASASAKKSGNKLTISNAFEGTFYDGIELPGEYTISHADKTGKISKIYAERNISL